MRDAVGKDYNPAPIPDAAGVAPLEKLPFDLQSREKIIRELKPQFIGFMVSRAFGGYVGVLALIVFAIAVGIILLSGVLAGLLSAILLVQVSEGFLISIAIIPLALLLIISIKPFISYGKSWYWITTTRVIGKRGFLGYSIDSIPLENVSDIVLSRTLLDRLLGLSSLIVVPMGGTNSEIEGSTTDEKFRNSNFFPALPHDTAQELQRVLFNLREELRKSRMTKSAFSESAPRSSEVAQQESDFPRGTT